MIPAVATCPCSPQAVSAHGIEPIATSALLAYELCRPLHASVASQLDWLALVGTVGDLQADGVKQFASQVKYVVICGVHMYMLLAPITEALVVVCLGLEQGM